MGNSSLKSLFSITTSATSLTADFALNATPNPAFWIMAISLAPSPTAAHSSEVIPSLSINSCNISAFEPSIIKGPLISPVTIPFSSCN